MMDALNYASIKPEEDLLRRVTIHPDHIHADGKPTSLAFRPRPNDNGKLSVNIQSLTTYEDTVLDKNRYRVYSVNAGYAISLNFKCYQDPIEGNPAHAFN